MARFRLQHQLVAHVVFALVNSTGVDKRGAYCG
jgi:hypothetical protein